MSGKGVQTPRFVWHYTTGGKFFQIIGSKELRPGAVGVIPPQRPILWFSANQEWEPTASKMWQENGHLLGLSKEETREQGGGLVRFGISLRKLHPWPKIRKKARMSDKTVMELEDIARKCGVSPKHWYGVTHSVPVKKIASIQVLNEADEWEEVDRPNKS